MIKMMNITTGVISVFLINFLMFNVSNCVCYNVVSKRDVNSMSIYPGLFFTVNNDGVKIKFNTEELFKGRALTKQQDDENGKQPKFLQRIGRLLMMIPMVIQVLSLPGALATIKMSLLKSVIIGKVSLIIMLYCLIQHMRSDSQVIVHQPAYHQPPPQHIDHYYNPVEDDEAWLGMFG